MNMSIELCRQRIEEVMKENGDTMASLARKLNLNRSTIHRWFSGEIGQIAYTEIGKIAKLYNVSVAYLFGCDVPKENESDEHLSLRDKLYDKLLFVSTKDLKKLDKMIDIFIEENKK